MEEMQTEYRSPDIPSVDKCFTVELMERKTIEPII